MSNVPMPFVPSIPQATQGPSVVPVMPQVAEKPAKKAIPSTPNKVIGAKIILQYKGEDGAIYEAVTTIDKEEYKVQSYSLNIEEKHEKKRDPETKDLIGFEDTGERIATFKLRYHVR
jgi:hypothetical protein